MSDEDKRRILFVFVTPSGHGLKVIFIADVKGNRIDNQREFSAKLGLNPDEACKDASRGAFLTTSDDILFIDNERLFTYENEEFGKKYNEQYHHGKSQPTLNQQPVSGGDGENLRNAESMMYNGVGYAKIIEAWMEGRNLTNHRHDTLVELTDHLRYLISV